MTPAQEAPGKSGDDVATQPEAHSLRLHDPSSRQPSPSHRPDSSGAWTPIPVAWLERSNISIDSSQFHDLLKLEEVEADAFVQAADRAAEMAKLTQAGEFVGRVMKQNDSVVLPALSEDDIRPLAEEAIAALPGNLSAAERDLARYVAAKKLEEEYGHDLEVTLSLTGMITISDHRHLPRHLHGFWYVARRIDSPPEARPMHHSINSEGRVDFLKFDPELNNGGQPPGDR
ncbi:hypothetical protein OKA04_20205 [Luteolibacter flavescens]|uniref:Uncharacterized protein n=1 Tax=Luteolibacter flavescens TaxID=1859460 RepID=A0ABT3FU53_9BACT|nr:hypothetical protein [Luteolibacter flavescens]MCW1887072.1 hypothetical protein [Luteolibacter flavescens]